jgi:formate--tetrahydrofolate ligase
VVVATARALKMHGGVAKSDLARENLAALQKGLANLARHVENTRKFGLDVVVAINRFDSDTEAEHALIRRFARDVCRAEAVVNESWGRGAAGAEALARAVVKIADASRRTFKPLYPDEMSLLEKTRTIAREIYRASDIAVDAATTRRFAELEAAGHGRLPICVAKTPYSFTADPTVLGAPTGHVMPVRDARPRAGAGFVVVMIGEISTMPGLPRVPAAEAIRVVEGRIEGLF